MTDQTQAAAHEAATKPFRLLDLPREIVEMIPLFDHKEEDKATILIQGPLHSSLLPLFRAKLYQSIILKSEKKLYQLWDTVKENEELGGLVKRLKIIPGNSDSLFKIASARLLLIHLPNLTQISAWNGFRNFTQLIDAKPLLPIPPTLKLLQLYLCSATVTLTEPEYQFYGGHEIKKRDFPATTAQQSTSNGTYVPSTAKILNLVLKTEEIDQLTRLAPLLPPLEQLQINIQGREEPNLRPFLESIDVTKITLLEIKNDDAEFSSFDLSPHPIHLAPFVSLQSLKIERKVLGIDLKELLEVKNLSTLELGLGAGVSFVAIEDLLLSLPTETKLKKLILSDVKKGKKGGEISQIHRFDVNGGYYYQEEALNKEAILTTFEGERTHRGGSASIWRGWKRSEWTEYCVEEVRGLIKLGRRKGVRVVVEAEEIESAYEAEWEERLEELKWRRGHVEEEEEEEDDYY